MSGVYLQSPVLAVYQPAPRQSWHRSKGFSLHNLPERYKPYVSVKPRTQASRHADFDPYRAEYLSTSPTPRSWRKNPLAMPVTEKNSAGASTAPGPDSGSKAQSNQKGAADSKSGSQPQASQNGTQARNSQKGATAPQNGPAAQGDKKTPPETKRSPAAEDKHPSNRTNDRFTPEKPKTDRSGHQAGSTSRYGESNRKPGLVASRPTPSRGGFSTPRYAGATPRNLESSTGSRYGGDPQRAQNLRLAYDYQGHKVTDEALDEEPDASPRNKPKVGREKIETQLRSNRVPETKVRRLAARISYMNDDDTTKEETQAERLERVLRHTVHNGLDPIVHGAPRKTNMDYFNHDPVGMSKKINEMAHDIQEEMLSCCELLGLREADSESGKPLGTQLREGIRDQQTEVEILQERIDKMEKEKNSIEKTGAQRLDEVEVLREQNFQQEKELKKLREDYMTLVAEIDKSRQEEEKLRKQVSELERTNTRLQQKAYSLEERNVNLGPELDKLHDENARLYADNMQLVNETRKLQGPDLILYHQMKALDLEVRELKIQNRRTESEKGQLKGALMKLEANYNLVQKEKRSLVIERNQLLKENQLLKNENRRLVLEK